MNLIYIPIGKKKPKERRRLNESAGHILATVARGKNNS